MCGVGDAVSGMSFVFGRRVHDVDYEYSDVYRVSTGV